MPELSIIILTFKSVKFIKPCLDSVFAQSYKDFEVIIVDNGSNDGTLDFIKKEYPQIILIENNKNLGAAKGRNLGINIANGRWILTLDCDVVLGKDSLYSAMKFIKELPSGVGMIQPKILGADKITIYSCGIYLSRPLKRFFDIGKGQIDRGQFNEAKYVFGSCSAAAFYRKQMLEALKEDTGYFDESFFFLVEDVDLSWRAQQNSFRALYYPQAVCYHYGNSSLFDRPMRQYLCWRNRKSFLKKCRLSKFQLALIFLAYDLPRAIFIFLTNSYARSKIIKKVVCGVD